MIAKQIMMLSKWAAVASSQRHLASSASLQRHRSLMTKALSSTSSLLTTTTTTATLVGKTNRILLPNSNSRWMTSTDDRLVRSFSSSASGGGPPRMPWQHPDAHKPGHHLQQYTIDLTTLAAENKLDPVIGREDEIRRCLQILARRTKVSTLYNNNETKTPKT
jgi:ATP-dependent Clp protease ATP-binding subunit ClpA